MQRRSLSDEFQAKHHRISSERNREFVDVTGEELDGDSRRFPTLGSLGLRTWVTVERVAANSGT